ncbi:hypothetical protein LTR85_005615 [Meristemomyces frigidus]|nr:hypothetical protein LTR85_005615 [Meristemomyces frigidus]
MARAKASDARADGSDDDANGGSKRKSEARDAEAGAAKRRSMSSRSGRKGGSQTPPESRPADDEDGQGKVSSGRLSRARGFAPRHQDGSGNRRYQPFSPRFRGGTLSAPAARPKGSHRPASPTPPEKATIRPQSAPQQKGDRTSRRTSNLASKVTRDATARRAKSPINVDEVRERIKAAGGSILQYYADAVKEGRLEPPIQEHEVVAAIATLLHENSPEHDWAKKKPIREHFQRRPEISAQREQPERPPAAGRNTISRSLQRLKKRIINDRGPLFDFYQRALVEGQSEPLISETEILDAIWRRLATFPDVDWTTVSGIRMYVPGRQRAPGPAPQPQIPPARPPPSNNPPVNVPLQMYAPPPPPPLPVVQPIPANKRLAAKALGFGGAAAGINDGQWNFKATLGEGRFGHAGLWVQRDRDHRIVGRMVAKETYLSPEQWEDEMFWADLERTQPREANLQRLLSNLKHSWCFVAYQGHAVYPDRHMHRIYMEYCPLGTLEDMIREHYSHFGEQDRDGNALSYTIPVPALWSIFEALAIASCLIRHSALPQEAAPKDWNRELVHRDLKPSNIMLGQPHSVKWRDIPVAKIGDFGLAIDCDEEGVINPDGLTGTGTDNTMAPEQHVYDDPALANRYELGSATNVFAIAKTMFSLMGILPSNSGYVVPARFDDPLQGRVEFTDDYYRAYPRNLIHLLQRCVEPIPDRRIECDELLRDIRHVVEQYPDEFDSAPMKFDDLPKNPPLWAKRDMYEMFSRY